MKYQVKFIEPIEGRDEIVQGGVSFHPNKTVTIDSDDIEMSPWFLGNPSFEVTEVNNETTEDKAESGNDNDGSADHSTGEDSTGADQAETKAVTPAKRVRKKVAAK